MRTGRRADYHAVFLAGLYLEAGELDRVDDILDELRAVPGLSGVTVPASGGLTPASGLTVPESTGPGPASTTGFPASTGGVPASTTG